MEQVGELTACQAVPEAMELHRQNTMCINLTAPPYRVIGLVTKESTLPCNVPVSHLFKKISSNVDELIRMVHEIQNQINCLYYSNKHSIEYNYEHHKGIQKKI